MMRFLKGWTGYLGLAALSALALACGGSEPPPTGSDTGNGGSNTGSTPSGPYGVIRTYMGTGDAGRNGMGQAPAQTQLYLPMDLTFGPDGRAYVLDWNNHRVLTTDGNTVDWLIGSGELGDGTAGVARQVGLNHPTHVSFDPQGRLILSAWHNSKVLRYDFATRMLEPIVGQDGARDYRGDGGPAIDAWINLPSATCFDGQGRLYISDQENQRVRRVDLSGIITTVVGTGEQGFAGDGGPATLAQLFAPTGQAAQPTSKIAMDSQDNLYLADTFNNRIRKVDANGIITTVAGGGGIGLTAGGFSGDGGPATRAALFWPCDVALDSQGNLFIADTFNNRIRKVDANGIITTVAGSGPSSEPAYGGDNGPPLQARLNRPYGVALDRNDNIYIADTFNHRIRIVPK